MRCRLSPRESGDLKKVLSNVKNRGIIGEIQLGAILEEILSPEQYDREVATVPRSSNHVEFAVKLPGNGDGSFVYLPIDSKFPGDTFAALQDAYDSGSPEAVADAKKQLAAVIKKCAKDIRDKYVSPPYTTNFGIMFLPFEGLYAEVVNSGLLETLRRDYNVTVTGPVNYGCYAQFAANGLSDPRYSEEKQSGMGDTRLSQDRIPDFCKGSGGNTKAHQKS